MVPSVQMDIVGIDQQEPEQDEQDLQGVFTAIHIVSIEDIGFLRGWQTILHRYEFMCQLQWAFLCDAMMICMFWIPYRISAASLQGAHVNLLWWEAKNRPLQGTIISELW